MHALVEVVVPHIPRRLRLAGTLAWFPLEDFSDRELVALCGEWSHRVLETAHRLREEAGRSPSVNVVPTGGQV